MTSDFGILQPPSYASIPLHHLALSSQGPAGVVFVNRGGVDWLRVLEIAVLLALAVLLFSY